MLRRGEEGARGCPDRTECVSMRRRSPHTGRDRGAPRAACPAARSETKEAAIRCCTLALVYSATAMRVDNKNVQ